MIRYVVVLGLGYVLGSKAGRRRYEHAVCPIRRPAVQRQPLVPVMIIQQPPETTAPDLEAQVLSADGRRRRLRQAIDHPDELRPAGGALAPADQYG